MSGIDKKTIEALEELSEVPLSKCAYAAEDEDGAVALCTEAGAPVVLMSKELYEEILEWKKKNPDK